MHILLLIIKRLFFTERLWTCPTLRILSVPLWTAAKRQSRAVYLINIKLKYWICIKYVWCYKVIQSTILMSDDARSSHLSSCQCTMLFFVCLIYNFQKVFIILSQWQITIDWYSNTSTKILRAIKFKVKAIIKSIITWPRMPCQTDHYNHFVASKTLLLPANWPRQ